MHGSGMGGGISATIVLALAWLNAARMLDVTATCDKIAIDFVAIRGDIASVYAVSKHGLSDDVCYIPDHVVSRLRSTVDYYEHHDII